ncbi:hypothetical protein HID58_095591 [Brassica napus]|uniref:Uncharacterized protein n=1 Tax=Brassica napus TaxID=3708 RepID=A0ABQ7X351_BRANA|nr:hypothetical protein HID58_095591 [Brassica napus]
MNSSSNRGEKRPSVHSRLQKNLRGWVRREKLQRRASMRYRTVYASFRTARANSLSQLYTQSMNHQKLSFQAERAGVLHRSPQYPQAPPPHQQCMSQIPVSLPLQARLAQQLFRRFGLSNAKTRPRTRFSQTLFQVPYAVVQNYQIPQGGYISGGTRSSELNRGSDSPKRVGVLHRGTPNIPKSAATSTNNACHQFRSHYLFRHVLPNSCSSACENQAKNSVFSNALSIPVRRSLQNYQIPQGGYISGGTRSSELNRGSDSPSSFDSSMDMHAE